MGYCDEVEVLRNLLTTIVGYKDLWPFFTFCAILGGVIIALIEIRFVRKSARSQLLMSLYDVWESDLLIDSRNLLRKAGSKSEVLRKIEEYDKKGQKEYFTILRAANYFEHIGHLVKKRYLKAKDIEGLMGSNVSNYYGLYESYSEKIKNDYPPYAYVFDNFKKLKEKIEKIRGSRFRKLKEKWLRKILEWKEEVTNFLRKFTKKHLNMYNN